MNNDACRKAFRELISRKEPVKDAIDFAIPISKSHEEVIAAVAFYEGFQAAYNLRPVLTVEEIESLVCTQNSAHELRLSEQQIEDMVESIHAALPTESEKDDLGGVGIGATRMMLADRERMGKQIQELTTENRQLKGLATLKWHKDAHDKIAELTDQIAEMREALEKISNNTFDIPGGHGDSYAVDRAREALAKYPEAK